MTIASTSLRSIVTLATLRKNRTRSPYGGDVDGLGGVVAVERHRVVAGLAFECVVVVARVPDERVVAGAREGLVIAVTAVDQIVALTAEDRSAPRPPSA